MKVNLNDLIKKAVILFEGAEDKISKLEKNGDLSEYDKSVIRRYENAFDWNKILSVEDFRNQIKVKLRKLSKYSDWSNGLKEVQAEPALAMLVLSGISARFKSSQRLQPKKFVDKIFIETLKEIGNKFKYKKFSSLYNHKLNEYAMNYAKKNVIYKDKGGGEWIEFKGNTEKDNDFLENRTALNALANPVWCLSNNFGTCAHTYGANKFYYRLDPNEKYANISIRMGNRGIAEISGGVEDGVDFSEMPGQNVDHDLIEYLDEFRYTKITPISKKLKKALDETDSPYKEEIIDLLDAGKIDGDDAELMLKQEYLHDLHFIEDLFEEYPNLPKEIRAMAIDGVCSTEGIYEVATSYEEHHVPLELIMKTYEHLKANLRIYEGILEFMTLYQNGTSFEVAIEVLKDRGERDFEEIKARILEFATHQKITEEMVELFRFVDYDPDQMYVVLDAIAHDNTPETIKQVMTQLSSDDAEFILRDTKGKTRSQIEAEIKDALTHRKYDDDY